MNQKLRLYDPWIFLLALAATGIGLLFIFDAGYARALSKTGSLIPHEFAIQFVCVIPALAAFYVCASLRPITWQKLSPYLGLIVLAMLFAVKKFGHSINGAQRWIGTESIRIEPSEFAKLAVVLYLAGVFANRLAWPKKIAPRKDFARLVEDVWIPKLGRFVPALWVLLAVGVIVLQPDLGTAAVVAATAFCMFIPGGVSKTSIAWAVGLSLVFGFYFVEKEPYRLNRITHHSSRWDAQNVDDLGYQSAQSELAEADGGIQGVGLGAGRAKHVIPEPTTDFVGATIGEETGLLGLLVVLTLMAGMVARLLYQARRAESRFSMLFLSGTAIWIGVQATVNLMMANAFLPAIGIPLPFVSSGGSSLLALWGAIGICQSCIKPVRQEIKEEQVATRDHRWWNRRTRLSRA